MAALAGVFAVCCSGMVYHATRRAAWRGLRSVGRFLVTAAVLGLASAWLAENWHNPLASGWAGLFALAMTLKLAGEHRLLRHADEPAAAEVWPRPDGFDAWSLAQGAVRMRDQLGLRTRLRFACGIVGGIALPGLSVVAVGATAVLAVAALALCFVGELLERHLFFRAVVPPRMPGGAA
jgi:DMSO reductase anchor subunit